MTTFDKVRNLIDCAADHAKTWQGRSAAESITLATGYAEPGYDEPESGVIAFGNWNKISHYDEANRKWIADDDIMPRLGNILEDRYDVMLEWEDEWMWCLSTSLRADWGTLEIRGPGDWCLRSLAGLQAGPGYLVV